MESADEPMPKEKMWIRCVSHGKARSNFCHCFSSVSFIYFRSGRKVSEIVAPFYCTQSYSVVEVNKADKIKSLAYCKLTFSA